MKTIAMYLPQFHRVVENDKWWGEGYTEWTAVRSAKPLFEGHYQPHVPLGSEYYDLLDKKTMQWQADLMHKYSVDGMCFYHYYFKNGRKILEKPAENLLMWKDIDMPFCFSWANESWIRTWSKIGGNTWNANIAENDVQADGSGILLRQDYGGDEEWIDHIEYLLPFFRDERYIKVNNKPLFLIYKADDINCLSEMLKCWNVFLREEGFDGLYLIGSNSRRRELDGYLAQQPSFSAIGRSDSSKTYDRACEVIVNDSAYTDEKTYLCGLVSYDDTPRRGKHGLVIRNADPELFKWQMKRLLFISERKDLDFVFVNAWNEWGEGMHLEPDEKYGDAFLKAIKEAKEEYNDIPEEEKENISKQMSQNRTDDDGDALLKKYKSHYHLLNKWMILKEEGRSLSVYFSDRKIKEIAVYGIGFLGKHLITELEGSGISVAYLIDNNKDRYKDYIIFHPSAQLPEVDLIVITPIDEYYEIANRLQLSGGQKIVSLEYVINDCFETGC